MLSRAGFFFTLIAGAFSVFLLGWAGYNGVSGDWVFGFLAVFWSLLMMLRLMTLTEPAQAPIKENNLAQKIIAGLHAGQEENRHIILTNSFGGSFFLFVAAGVLFAAWQIYCAAFPAQSLVMDALALQVSRFFGDASISASLSPDRFFDWGQGFMLFLSFSMMAFVLRSHASDRRLARPALLILCGYAVAGFIIFIDIAYSGRPGLVADAALTGNGNGASAYLLGHLPDGQPLTLFDLLLLESGIGGLAILAFLLFVPLGYISLSAQQGRTDWVVVTCGCMAGLILILSIFLTYNPAIGGLMALCAMALFLAWGASENTAPLTKEQK